MSELLRVRELTIPFQMKGKIFNIVEKLSFDLTAGKTLVLVGESGSGKSMTALSLMGILPKPPALAPQGEVLYQGQNLLALSEKEMREIRGRHIGMIFQDPAASLNPVYTIGEQLQETLLAHFDLEEKNAYQKSLKMLEDVHLPYPEEVMKAYPHQLSGGMLQRAMIAMALICDPDILIADEPTTALDVTIQAQILTLLKELQEKKEMAILVITHDMGVVAEIADQVVVVYGGQKIEEGKAVDIFDNPSHPYTQALFSSMPDKRVFGKLTPFGGNPPSYESMPEGCIFNPRCRFAMSLCKKEIPPYFPLKENDHFAKCFLYDKDLQWKLGDDETFRS